MAHKTLTKAIAKELEKGMICYVHKQSRKITTIAALEEGVEGTPERQSQLEALEKNIHKYYRVPQMSPVEETHIKEDFLNENINSSIKRELSKALKRDNPTRNFMKIIDDDEGLQQYWLNFKAEWYQEWVRGYLLDIYRY